VSSEEPPAASPEPSPPDARPHVLRRVWRVIRGVLTLAAVVIAVAFVTVFSVDLGPWVRARAEQEGAKFLKRDFTIGRISARLLRGQFIIEDLKIGGLTPEARPFFTAKKLTLSVPWWSIIRRELIVESVDLTDWDMFVQSFPDGRHTFPRFARDTPPSQGPRRFVTTVRIVRASRGRFTYDDQGSSWSIAAPNLNMVISKAGEYRGEAGFKGGLVQIGQFEPMWANMHSRFKIDGGQVLFDRIDLTTDGATSAITGTTDLARWPEQFYQVRSRVDFTRMRELFFARDKFTLAGDGQFVGSFHLFKGGRELKGTFASEEARLNQWRFPALQGSLLWVRDRFEVTNASSAFASGDMSFDFSMKPLGDKERRGQARFDVKYEGVDLTQVTDTLELQGVRLAGLATGRNLLEWPLGRFRDRHGDGEISVQPPAGVTLQARQRERPRETAAQTQIQAQTRAHPQAGGPRTAAPATRGPRGNASAVAAAIRAAGPAFDATPFRAPLAIGGQLRYRYDPSWIDVAPGWVATPRTYVEMQGRTAWGGQSQMPFHVTSGDWQESDRVLAGIITAFGSPTRAVLVGGTGTFDGVMTGAFRRPRVEGQFTGDRMRAWDVEWGRTDARLVIENQYADIANAVITRGESRMDLEGRYSLGFPRRDGGEEINARVRLTKRPVADLKHAFNIDDYDVDGALTGEFHIYGRYQRPYGFGRLTLDRGVAYGESFDTASAGLRFEGEGVRLDAIRAAKGGGEITGAAYLAWTGSYSFNADGRRIPVERVDAMTYPELPLFGMLQFSASGSGTFDNPRYDVRGRIDDLFVVDEGIGQVTGRLSVRDNVLTIEQLEAASPRLAVSGTGRVNLTPSADAEITLRFSDTSLDPYVRVFEPRLSPFTTAIVSGTVQVRGALRDRARLRVDGTVEDIDLRLFDYRLRNDGPVRLSLANEVARVERLKFVGDGTTLELFGDVGLKTDRVRIRALGDANLGILQGFFREIRSSGSTEIQAEITGPIASPVIVGAATVRDGRIRYFGLPHSLEAVNGRVEFDAGGVRLDGLTGRMGGGDIRFGGRLGLRRAAVDSFAITAMGRDMQLRYPEGFRSRIDADLALRGHISNPILSGAVQVRDSVWVKSIDTEGTGIFGFAATGGGGAVRSTGGGAAAAAFPLRFDVRIDAPSSLRIENSTARLVSSAELTLRGTYDKPALFGRADINRGEIYFEGNRYVVTRGTLDFSNPSRIDPFFDIEAETQARTPGQIYRVLFRVSGTRERFVWDLSSDPPLASVDILALLFGEARDVRDSDLRALRERDQTEQELIASRAARLLTSPLTSEVGRVVKKTFGVDSVQIAPSLGDLSSQQSARFSPTARLIIGKRISDRLFLTYAQPLTSSRPEQLVLVEYNHSDRLSWIISRNEDETYALDVRVRHVF